VQGRARCWDLPIQVSSRVSLPARQAATTRRPQGVLEAAGSYNCVDVWVALSGGWWDENILLQVKGVNGPMETVFDQRAVQDLQGPPLITIDPVSGAVQTVVGLLFSIRGKACDKFIVEAFHGAVDLGDETDLFYARAWGGDIGIYGDRNTRLPIDLHARPNQLVGFSGDPTNTLIIPPNPNGGRIAITHVDWTGEEAAVEVILQDEPPVGVPVDLLAFHAPAAGAATGARVNAPYTSPVFTRRGAGIRISTTVAAPADNALNVRAFYE
jgi:hypothetical protein